MIVPRSLSSVAAVIIVLTLAACDTHQKTAISVSSTTAPSLIFTTIAPETLVVQRLLPFGCPLRSPFATAFDLVIRQPSPFDVLMNQVRFDFFDVGGFTAPPLLFSATDLSGLFGSTLVRAGTTRSFRFQPQFGCGLAFPGQVIGRVVLTDLFGRVVESTTTARMK